MTDLRYLWDDPRPDLRDSPLWQRLFRLIPNLEYRRKCDLHIALWTLRCFGVMIRQTHNLTEFIVDTGPDREWVTTDDFKRDKHRYLEEHRESVSQLLRQL
ncbi:hypothetical protein [Paenibacillus cymbidii]|uniref:hypothetical protein n=1 Tax=Paenibacillus cymbidii TaxID=1639034 RepID=UPI0010822AF1|nr:hypothetical protein [Paenibacillus cymbidii]